MKSTTLQVTRNGSKRGRLVLYSSYASRTLFEIPDGAYAELEIWSDSLTLLRATTQTENLVLYLEEVTPESGPAVRAAVSFFLSSDVVTAILARKHPVFYRIKYFDGEDVTPLAEGRVVEKI